MQLANLFYQWVISFKFYVRLAKIELRQRRWSNIPLRSNISSYTYLLVLLMYAPLSKGYSYNYVELLYIFMNLIIPQVIKNGITQHVTTASRNTYSNHDSTISSAVSLVIITACSFRRKPISRSRTMKPVYVNVVISLH